MRIEYYPDERWLYFGSMKTDIQDPIVNKKIDLITEESHLYEKNTQWRFWKYLFSKDSDRIYLSDFSHKGTFDLIKEDKRNNKIELIISELDLFLKELKD